MKSESMDYYVVQMYKTKSYMMHRHGVKHMDEFINKTLYYFLCKSIYCLTFGVFTLNLTIDAGPPTPHQLAVHFIKFPIFLGIFFIQITFLVSNPGQDDKPNPNFKNYHILICSQILCRTRIASFARFDGLLTLV